MQHPDFEKRRKLLKAGTLSFVGLGSGLVNPLDIFAQISGIQTVVLAHGRGGSSREPMMRELQFLFQEDGLTVISDDLGSDFTPRLNEWRLNFARSVDKAKGDTLLLGWSLGARICMDYVYNFDNPFVKKAALTASRELNPSNTPLPEFYAPPIPPQRVITGFPDGRAVIFSNKDTTLKPDATEQVSQDDPGPMLATQINAVPKFIPGRGHFGSIQDAKDIHAFLRQSFL